MNKNGFPRAKLKPTVPIGVCLLGLCFVNFIIFHDHWLGRRWFPFDFPAGYYGTVAYWVTSLQSGEWPQWIPYQSMGYPLLMNPQIGFFYPPFWAFVVLRIPYTLHAAVIVQVLHVLFGSIGFLLLARRLFGSLLAAECGAVAFMLFGGFYTNSEHADIIRGFAWMPWLFWGSLLNESRLRMRNLALPAVVACYITGAYTGQVISGLLLLGIFLILQAAQLFRATRDSRAGRTLLLQFGAVGLGVLLAGAYLATGMGLASQLTRAQGLSSLPVHFLTGKSPFDLIFPSNMIHPGEDYSMSGMQLPIVLLLFAPLIELRFLKKLLPFFGLGAVAALMSFVQFIQFSNGIRHLLPVLGFSRFPAADYRGFVYLPILLLLTGGLASAIDDGKERWRKTVLTMGAATLFAAVCLACLQAVVAPALLNPFLELAKTGVLILFGTSLLYLLCCRFGKPWIAGLVILPLNVMVMLPVVDAEQQFWSDPTVLRLGYDGVGRPLELHGELRTRAIFRRHERERGPRVTGDFSNPPSWWGYLDGAYLTNDSGGVIPRTRRTAELNPALLKFMREGSRILQIPCAGELCDVRSPTVDLSSRSPAGVPVEYRRNSLAYDVDVPVRSLVVENEIAIRGWRISVDGQRTAMKKVNGCVRGWVVSGGKHRVTLHYQTPLLLPGLLLSAAAFAVWIAILWRFRTASGAGELSSDCVILVSSDRTGG